MADELEVIVELNRDIPESSILLKNAKIITMNQDEIIENGQIYIVNNRIKEVSENQINIDESTEVIDVNGKTILPGFVDTHAHMRPSWGLQKINLSHMQQI